MDSNRRSSKPAGAGAPAKKPYSPPKLTFYGSVKKLTKLAKRRRVSDGSNKQT